MENIGEGEVTSEGHVGVNTSSIDELKRAFEFVEVSSPGVTDQLLGRIAAYLQHRCVYECVCESNRAYRIVPVCHAYCTACGLCVV